MKRPDETQADYEARIAHFTERKEARADRFEELANKHRQQSDARYLSSRADYPAYPIGTADFSRPPQRTATPARLGQKSHTHMRKEYRARPKRPLTMTSRAEAARHNTAISSADPASGGKVNRQDCQSGSAAKTQMKEVNRDC